MRAEASNSIAVAYYEDNNNFNTVLKYIPHIKGWTIQKHLEFDKYGFYFGIAIYPETNEIVRFEPLFETRE